MEIPDSLWALLIQLPDAINSVGIGPLTIGPANVTVTGSQPFGGAPFTLTCVMLDGSPTKTLVVATVPPNFKSLLVAPVTISYNPGIGAAPAIITNVKSTAIEVDGALVVSIVPAADGKSSQVNLFVASTNSLLSLHVAVVPSSLSVLKSFNITYVPGVNGALDTIIG